METSFDLVIQTTERRNELLNVLDLLLEWGREEMESIWTAYALSMKDMVRMIGLLIESFRIDAYHFISYSLLTYYHVELLHNLSIL